MTKSATKEGTRRYAQRFAARAASGHFREAQRMLLSSLGLGTYLGQPDKMTDEAYTAAVVAAAESGINLFDSAINYRFQRSERSIGAALEQLAAYFFREYIQPGIFTAKDLAAGSHCMAPKFLKDQLGRSLKNLRVECLDVYYLHNPETQLSEIAKPEFLDRLRTAFEFLESAVAAGEIRYYGVATWNGFRRDPRAEDAMQLADIAQTAQEIAGGMHHFRFVQLPFNLGMPEALTLGNQILRERGRTLVELAGDLDITVIASASLLQGQLARNLPEVVAEAFGLENAAERALQFARSAPGITAALVGMSRVEHVKANARMVNVAPATVEDFGKLFARGESA